MTAPGTGGSSRPEELVVSLEHESLLTAFLAEHGVRVLAADRSADLGLAKLTLADLDSPTLQEIAGPAPTPLDVLLRASRRELAARHAGWFPVMGKNRYTQDFTPAGVISHGGDDDPTALAGSTEEFGSWPPRDSGPGAGVRVCVLDTGIAPNPALAGRFSARFSDRLPATGSRSPLAGHATFITGLVLSQAPGSVVTVRRVLDHVSATGDAWSTAQEIVRAARTGADVVNLSFLCHTEDDRSPLVLQTAVDRIPRSTVVVAAAGNHGQAAGNAGGRPSWPAALPSVVAVGATGTDGRVAPFTPTEHAWIDVLAEGQDLQSTFPVGEFDVPGGRSVRFSGYASWSGTSFAAALVSGAIAAGVEPGRISAREAWEDLRDTLDADQLGSQAEGQVRTLVLTGLRGRVRQVDVRPQQVSTTV